MIYEGFRFKGSGLKTLKFLKQCTVCTYKVYPKPEVYGNLVAFF